MNQHGNTKSGHCKICGNENPNDFYKNKKSICKKCFGEKMQDYKQTVKLDNQIVSEKDKKVSALDKLTELTETVNKLIELNTDKDLFIKELSQKMDIQTLLIQQLTNQIIEVKNNQIQIDEDLHEIAEVQQETRTESGEARCNIDKVKEFLQAVEENDLTVKKLEEIADYFEVTIPKANNVKKGIKREKLIQQLNLLINKSS